MSGLYSFIYYKHDNTYYFRGEDHNFWEMVFVDKGEISVIVEKNAYTLNQGEIIFHKPNEFHAHSSTSEKGHSIIVTSFETDSKAMQFFNNKAFSLNDSQKIIEFFNKSRKRNQSSFPALILFGPIRHFFTASALSSPETSTVIFFAAIIVPNGLNAKEALIYKASMLSYLKE